jgi:hypothetical protein
LRFLHRTLDGSIVAMLAASYAARFSRAVWLDTYGLEARFWGRPLSPEYTWVNFRAPQLDSCSNSRSTFLVLIEQILRARSQQIRNRSHVPFRAHMHCLNPLERLRYVRRLAHEDWNH